MEVKSGETTIFREDKPNSQAKCQPLLIALVDENDLAAFTTMTCPMVHEREHLENGEMKFAHGDATSG